MTTGNYALKKVKLKRSRHSYLSAGILALLMAIGVSHDLAAQCASAPAPGLCIGGNGPATNGVNINSGETYWFTGVGAFSNGVNLNGGTLRVCGNLNFTTMNYNGGNIIIEAGGTLTINGGGPLGMNGNSIISNSGTLNMNRGIVMQNSNNTIFNAIPTATINMNSGAYSLDINSATSLFINNGTANIHAVITQGNSAGAVCLGPLSCMNLTNMTNNVTNSYNAPIGPGVVRYTGNALLNNALTNTANVVICKATGATMSGSGGFGSATVVEDCPSCSLALPIELLSFEGKQENEGIALKWATAAEIQNDYFTIEKSTDGIHWDGIGNILGAGNSTQTFYYTFKDIYPQKGTQYYRLRQTDFDGTATLSGVISINFETSANTFLIYPNPNRSNRLNILGFDNDAYYTLELKNVTGKLLYIITFNTNSIELPDIGKGIYLLSISSEGDLVSKTFKYIVQ